MSKTIWKYPLTISKLQEIDMPKGAEILTAQMQDDEPVLWALVDPDQEKERRFIEIYGTGHWLDGDPRKYISTFQIMESGLVFHVFEYLGI